MILSRYAGIGSHRYPLGFSGDTAINWKVLDFQPYFTANAANCGYTWWSHDIGGHHMGEHDDELYIRETGLYKLSTPMVMDNPEISRTVRRNDAFITEVNPTYVIAMKSGRTEEIMDLYYKLDEFGCILQYTRSGRIAVTRSATEEVTKLLEEREKGN